MAVLAVQERLQDPSFLRECMHGVQDATSDHFVQSQGTSAKDIYQLHGDSKGQATRVKTARYFCSVAAALGCYKRRVPAATEAYDFRPSLGAQSV
jgi:hypothetical protein